MKIRILAAAFVAALAAPAADAHTPSAVVEAVQYPAWLERDGRSVPLTPGTALRSNDRLRTGDNARVEVRLAEGSTVKVGQKARFAIEKVENRGIFRAALNVIDGAFRFTTDKLVKTRKRDVVVKVRNVTAGIRGTDLWGKSTDERDIVCLLEGRISVGSEGHPTVTLDQPLDFYIKPRNADPKVDKVDAAKVKEWAAETDLAPGAAAARRGGRWRVVAASFTERDPALALNRELRASGYPSEVAGGTGRTVVVQVPGLAGEAEAQALAKNLRTVPGVSDPTVVEAPAAGK